MTNKLKQEILELFQELLRDAYISKTEKSDWSGCNTEYFVDQDKLMDNINKEIMDLCRGKDE